MIHQLLRLAALIGAAWTAFWFIAADNPELAAAIVIGLAFLAPLITRAVLSMLSIAFLFAVFAVIILAGGVSMGG